MVCIKYMLLMAFLMNFAFTLYLAQAVMRTMHKMIAPTRVYNPICKTLKHT